MTTIQIQKFASDLAERVVGDTIEVPTVEKFLNDWLAGKKAKDSSAGTIVRYGHSIRLFIDYLGEFAKAQITSVAPKHIDGFMTHRLQEEHLGLLYESDALTDFICPGLAARTTGGNSGLSQSFKRLVGRPAGTKARLGGRAPHPAG